MCEFAEFCTTYSPGTVNETESRAGKLDSADDLDFAGTQLVNAAHDLQFLRLDEL